MAVLVSDIRSFAALSETMSPQENFDFINEYFGRVSPLIRKHSGFIVKYMGDGIMAIFPDRIDHALRAAIAQIQEVTQLGSELERKGKSAFKIGIGIHTGETMLGTVGEAERMQTDLLSDTVNLASRLEGLTKIYGASIVISGQTRNRLQDPSQYQMRSLGKVQVVGRRATEDVYEVFEGDPAELLEAKSKTRSEFERGLDTYMKHSFAEASVLFTSVLKTNPVDQAAQLYLKRSAHYMIQGVPDGWNGSEEMTEK